MKNKNAEGIKKKMVQMIDKQKAYLKKELIRQAAVYKCRINKTLATCTAKGGHRSNIDPIKI